MATWLITAAAFVAVSALVGAVAVMLRERTDGRAEDRLEMFATTGGKGSKKDTAETVLLEPLDGDQSALDRFFDQYANLTLLFEQADTNLRPATFFLISGVLGLVGAGVAWYFASIALVPVAAALMALLPLVWLLFRRRKRLKNFGAQLPDALELIARALRAGHSLQAGFNLVQDEMPDPIAKEFGRVFEEQNLGVPFDESLESLSTRIPNTDLRFFTTAIILQRQTGGDLAEILDKIGNLIRERFRIWGQVQALTGEGRLSGIVLLGLPPVLFLAVYHLNPQYVSVLFTDPMGKQMLAGGVFLQVIGALVIRKIINIKV